MKSYWHSGCLASAGAATVLLLSPNPGAAQSNAELMDIIRQQQRQIEELSRKVDALQGQAQQATEKANTATETANTPRESQHRHGEGRHGRGDGAEGREGSARHQGQVGARADLLEQGRQLVGARARPPAGGRRRARRRRRFLQERQRHRAAPRAPRRRGQLLSGLEVQVRGRLRQQQPRHQGRLHRVQRRVRGARLRPRRPVQDAERARAGGQRSVHHVHGEGRDHRRVRARLPDRSGQRRER